jgi:hypothetical protein
MKTLFRLAGITFGTDWSTKQQIYSLVDQEQADLFSWINLGERRGQTLLGKALSRFDKRCLGGIILKISGGKNSRRYQFSKMDDQGSTIVTNSEGTSGTSDAVDSVSHSAAPKKRQDKQKPVQGTSGTSNGVHSASPPPAVDESSNSQNIKQGTSGTPKGVHSMVIPSKSSFTDPKQGTWGTSGTYSLPRRENPKEGSGVSICVDKIQYKKGGHYVPEVPYVPSPPKHRFLADKAVLGQIVETIRQSEAAVALDIETYGDGLNPWRGDIRLLSLAIPDHPAKGSSHHRKFQCPTLLPPLTVVSFQQSGPERLCPPKTGVSVEREHRELQEHSGPPFYIVSYLHIYLHHYPLLDFPCVARSMFLMFPMFPVWGR